MELSPLNAHFSSNYVNKNVSFGMASFTEEGLRLAQASSDVFEPLSSPVEFHDGAFFQNKKMFQKAPFAKYLESNVKKRSSAEDAQKVADEIIACGTSTNSFSNSKFIKQLLTTKAYINKLPEDTKAPIVEAIAKVFEVNWNNPEITKAETFALLEMSKGPIDDKQYVTLTGVIEKCDAKRPRGRK